MISHKMKKKMNNNNDTGINALAFFVLGIPTCWYLKFALPPTRTPKFALPPTQTPNASRWNIGGIRSPTQNCASFSALAMRKLANANADSGGIQAFYIFSKLISRVQELAFFRGIFFTCINVS